MHRIETVIAAKSLLAFLFQTLRSQDLQRRLSCPSLVVAFAAPLQKMPLLRILEHW